MSDPSPGRARPHLVWVTNFAAPYRRPVWQELSRFFRLSVLLTNDEEMAVRSHRTSWLDLDVSGYDLVPLDLPRTRVGFRNTLGRGGALRDQMRASDAVLLGGWEQPIYWQALVFARRHRIPVFGFYESTKSSQQYPRGPINWVRSRFFRRLDGVVTPGESASRAIREMGVPDARIHTGFNAVDVMTFHRSATARRSAQDRGRDDEGHRFLYVGQLITRKNVHGLIDAFAEVARAHDHLTIVGAGPRDADLRARAAASTAADRISFLGNVEYDDLPDVMAREDTLVLPSTEEVWGLVVNEALAAGLGVVVSEQCGVAASVRGMRGVVVSDANPRSLAASLAAARDAWDGPIADPEILQMTPERFAHVFRDCVMSSARIAGADRRGPA